MYNWKIITIGHLSRNRYWGEDEEIGYRMPLATSTLIFDDKEKIIVDPSLPPEEMEKSLFDNSGIKPEEITKVFSTHNHYDHLVSPDLFKNAKWYMSGIDLEDLKENLEEYKKIWKPLDKDIVMQYTSADEVLAEGITTVALPGHTKGTTGLLFDAPEGKVLISGDSIMTNEFFQNKKPYFFCRDLEESENSIDKAVELADFIIPGHGNAFSVKAYHPENKKVKYILEHILSSRLV